MKILMLSPGFPTEMVLFTEGLAAVGAQVIGVGEQPPEALPGRCRQALAAYIQVPSLFDEAGAISEIGRSLAARRIGIDRVECLWEPLMILAARLRETLGLPGMTVAETVPFRNKSAMKTVLDAAGVRTPRHVRSRTIAGCREAAEKLGFPLVIKPIAGAGSADTYRVNDAGELEPVLQRLGHVPEVSVEEYIGGEEYTFDTLCVDGQPLYFNISWYRPRPLIARSVQWISPQTVTLRNVEAPHLRPGRELGQQVLKALGFRDGFTHMEWFLTGQGEAVFGEIGARPPGARSVDTMNYACDVDLYRGWAEATVRRRFSQPVERRYNVAVIFKRAQGEGRIQRVEGLDSLLTRFGDHVVHVELLPIGAPRRNWKQTLLSDGHLIVRHPDLQSCLRIADAVGTDLQLYAG